MSDNKGLVTQINPRSDLPLNPSLVPKRRSTDRPRDYSARRAAIAVVAFALGIYAAWAVFAGWLP